MFIEKIRIKNISPHAVTPVRGTPHAAGYDVSIRKDEAPFALAPGERKLVKLGWKIELPVGWLMWIVPRSGNSLKFDITVANSPGLVDSDYRGEVGVIVVNRSDKTFTFEPGDRIAQAVFQKHESPDFQVIPFDSEEELADTERGAGGFGSTGRK